MDTRSVSISEAYVHSYVLLTGGSYRPKAVVHSLLACRMVLHLRRIAERLMREGGVVPFTSIQFAEVEPRKPKWWHPAPAVEGIAMTVITETYASAASKVKGSETEAQKVRHDIQDRVFDITRL